MLLGWLFLGGAGIAAGLTNTVRRAKGISNKERMYTDVKGVTRYTKNKLPYNQAYERIKSGQGYNHIAIKVWKEAYEKACKEEGVNSYSAARYKERLDQEIAKGKHTAEFMKNIDRLERERLRKQGYDV